MAGRIHGGECTGAGSGPGGLASEGTVRVMPIALPLLAVMLALLASPPSVDPVPSPETRSHDAGWRGRSWLDQHEDGVAFLTTSTHPQGADVVLLGDSITQSFGGEGRDTGQPGRAALESALPGVLVANQGISGDRTQHLLWRLEHGALAGRSPGVVAIMIGTNNLPHDTGAEIGAGVIEVVRTVRRVAPDSLVLLIAIPPRGASPDDRENPMRRRGEIANTLARHHASTDPSVVWVDPWAALLDADGRPRDGFLAGDAVHLGPDGYRLWAEVLAAHLPNPLEDSPETSP